MGVVKWGEEVEARRGGGKELGARRWWRGGGVRRWGEEVG